MASGKKLAIVTGGNKGIGLAVVEQLAAKFTGGDVYLTARNKDLGTAAAKELADAKGLKNVKFHQLDILDDKSVKELRNFVEAEYGGIDVLVNNAGIAFKNDATEPMHVQAQVTIDTNYYATKRVCEALFPLLRPGARVVNVSSAVSYLNYNFGLSGDNSDAEKALKAKLASSDSDLTVPELDALMEEFKAATVDQTHKAKGWGNSTYGVSKVGLSALTRIQAREIRKARPEDDIAINHIHPGYVDTDMTSGKGTLKPEEGAKSTVFAALLPPNTDIKGQYIWVNCEVVDWVNGPVPSRF